jgi:predicted MPP superfamily phosphohydrolase
MSIGRLILFLVVVGGLDAAIHYYLWMRLVRDPALSGAARTATTYGLVFGAVSIIVAMLVNRAPRVVSTPIAWVAYTWLGVMFFLFVSLVAGDVVRIVVGVVDKIKDTPTDPDRRRFIARSIASVAGLFAFGMSAVGVVNVLSRVAVKKVSVKIDKLADGARGYKIVQVTDIHVGPTIGRGFIEEIVASVNALEPDLIAITGDLVDGSVDDIGEAVRPLAKLRAKDGVFFVTGNHEYYSGADEWLAFLGTLGIRSLRNERISLPRGIDVAGVDDASATGRGHGEDMEKALGGRDKSRAIVLLAHQPRQVERAAAHGVDLQISGHTHGGQMFPWGFFVRLQQPYIAGLDTHPSGTQIYVSRGTGYWGPPMRVGSPAEITEITLA